MNSKKYFLINLRQYLVLYIVSFALLATSAATSVLSFTMYKAEYFVDGLPAGDYGVAVGGGILSSPFASMYIIFFILLLIAPLFAMSYRYSLPASDAYRQVAQKKNSIRIMNHMTILGALVVIFSVVFWIMFLALILKYNYGKIPENNISTIVYDEGFTQTTEIRYSRLDIHFGYFVLMYALFIGFGIFQYFISYFFVSRSNRMINSVFTLLFGELALALLMFSIYSLINIFDTIDTSSPYSVIGGLFNSSYIYDETVKYPINQIAGSANSSIFFPIMLLCYLCEPKFTGQTTPYDKMTGDQIGVFVVSLIIFVLMAILGALSMILEKDPSGEYAGKPETHNNHQYIVFHIGAGSIGLAIVSLLYFNIIACLVVLAILIALYFVFIGVFRRNFKIDLKNLIPYVSVSLVCFVLGLVLSLINM
ncbi:MAG: hypothetical protein K6E11_01415 [Bacilli bacterium]|nr:hypothetical protein [Bacilli bacterium]